MQIIKTEAYIKLSDSIGGDYNTQPGFKRPEDNKGSSAILSDDSDSTSDIEKKWNKKQRKKTPTKKIYQTDGVPGDIV